MNNSEKNLLVVDNDEDWLALLERFFSAEGYKVYSAQTCGGALKSAAARKPACIIVDLNLGGEDGLSVCCAVKADPELKGVPVIILSGADAPEMNCGCTYDAFVCKAQGVAPLLAAVKKLTA